MIRLCRVKIWPVTLPILRRVLKCQDNRFNSEPQDPGDGPDKREEWMRSNSIRDRFSVACYPDASRDDIQSLLSRRLPWIDRRGSRIVAIDSLVWQIHPFEESKEADERNNSGNMPELPKRG
jgi:hypothetical protein